MIIFFIILAIIIVFLTVKIVPQQHEYVIETFKSLVAKAHQENDDYRWVEGRYHLRFEYRKNIGLHLMYVPLQEGED